MRSIIRTLVFLGLLVSPYSQAEDGWIFNVELGVRQVYFEVYDSGNMDSLGSLTESINISPELAVESSIKYFTDSKWGYKSRVDFSIFNLNKQLVGANHVSMGSEVKGFNVQAMPILLYDFLKNSSGHSLFIGYGLGLGFVSSSGDILLTKAQPPSELSLDLNLPTLAYRVYIEYGSGSWSYRFGFTGQDFSKDSYDHSLLNYSMTVSKHFSI